jgi:hypothetical protein
LFSVGSFLIRFVAFVSTSSIVSHFGGKSAGWGLKTLFAINLAAVQ